MKRAEFSPKTKAQAFLRCNGKCENEYCGIKLFKKTVNYDHIVSDKICKEQGIKSNTLDNCQCLCVDCHVISKTPKDMLEIVKRRKQDKRYSNGGAAVRKDKGQSFRPVKREIQARPFDKKPKNYKYDWNK